MKIRTKLILLLVAMALLPLVGLSVIRSQQIWSTARELRSAALDDARSRVADELTVYTRHVGAVTAASRRVVEQLVARRAARLERDLDTRELIGPPAQPRARGGDATETDPRLRRLEDLGFVPAPAVAEGEPPNNGGAGSEAETGAGSLETPVEDAPPAWYAAARDAGRTVWLAPARAEGSARLTCAEPVYGNDGTFAGAVGASVPLADLVLPLDLPSRLATGVELTLLIHPRSPTDRSPAPLRAATRPPTAVDWLEPRQLEPVEDGGPISSGGAPDRVRVFGGEISGGGAAEPTPLVVQAPIAPSVSLVARAPAALIEAEADRLQERLDRMAREQLRLEVGLTAVLGLVIALVGWAGGKSITRPLRRLADAVEGLGEGDMDVRASVSRRDEIGRLARAFNRMVPEVKGRLDDPSGRRAAARLQASLNTDPPPTWPRYAAASRAIVSERIGGDFFQYFDRLSPGDGHAGGRAVAVGDVAGDGLAAATLATEAKTLLRTSAASQTSLRSLAERLNTELLTLIDDGRFVSMFLACLPGPAADGGTEVAYINAGHDPALLYDPDADRFELLTGGGMPLGIDERASYTDGRATLPRGGLLLIGTDGVTAARNHAGEPFGRERVQDVLRRHGGASPDVIADALLAAIESFAEDAPRLDDITFVIIKHPGENEPGAGGDAGGVGA